MAGANQCDSTAYDTVKGGGSTVGDAKWWADYLHKAGMIAGFVGVGVGIVGIGVGILFPPAGALIMAAGLGIGIGGAMLDAASAVFYGIGYGWTSNEFKKQAGIAALGALTIGASGVIGIAAKGVSKGSHLVAKVSEVAHEAVSPIVSWLSSKGH
ncbi:hypothetical protein AB0D46_08345 [Streptomyces sp. NPDC048383]|uniref:hypothetical protein n=1 Tax=Streptomyces sp. NPDC048383 TaxID=3155386 RepID=UPI003427B993